MKPKRKRLWMRQQAKIAAAKQAEQQKTIEKPAPVVEKSTPEPAIEEPTVAPILEPAVKPVVAEEIKKPQPKRRRKRTTKKTAE